MYARRLLADIMYINFPLSKATREEREKMHAELGGCICLAGIIFKTAHSPAQQRERGVFWCFFLCSTAFNFFAHKWCAAQIKKVGPPCVQHSKGGQIPANGCWSHSMRRRHKAARAAAFYGGNNLLFMCYIFDWQKKTASERCAGKIRISASIVNFAAG